MKRVRRLQALLTGMALLLCSCGNGAGMDAASAGSPAGAAGEASVADLPAEGPETAGEDAAGEAASGSLAEPSAAAEKKERIFAYLEENFGTYMLSCQQESTWMTSPEYEMDYLLENTGQLPAMRGLDFMNNDFEGVVQRAKDWDARGGIVTICWHTGVKSSGYEESKKDHPNFKKLLTEGTDEYRELMESWDLAATALQELRDAGVPVLWRPFHEFDGKWFWWGKGNGENFIRLWQLMYDKFTYEYGLDNLIWVLGYSEKVKDGWYPGDEYVDIIGSDNYDDSTNARAWKKLEKITTDKPMAFHECGNVPSVEDFTEDGTIWSWFMIWHTEWLTKNDTENLKAVYNSDLVITLDELPDFEE